MDLKLKDKRVLVTGGTKGIGFVTAAEFRSEGAYVEVACSTLESCRQAQERWRKIFGEHLNVYIADLREPSAPRDIHKCSNGFDIIVNNAGAVPIGELGSISTDQARDAMQLKLHGYERMIEEFSPQMLKNKSGAICNVIGIGGVKPRYTYYYGTVANAALIAATKALGGAFKRDGVSCFGINPGRTYTERLNLLLEREKQLHLNSPEEFPPADKGPFIEPGEIARMIVFGCSPLALHLSGSVIDYDGGALYRDRP